MPKKNLRFGLLIVWVVLTLALSHFHEPWRDEAQAWLVARHSQTIGELLWHSSLEATGPLYYIGLWPIAHIFPHGFPLAQFIYSWLGTALAVGTMLFFAEIPLPISGLLAFSFLFGFEFSDVARLYGWGSFFLLAGAWSDSRNRRFTATLAFSFCILTQISLAFGVAVWCARRLFRASNLHQVRTTIFRYAPLFVALGLAWWHQHLAADVRSWNEWRLQTTLTKIGANFGAPFLHTRGSMGLLGFAVIFAVMAALDLPDRWAMALGLAPFMAIFLFNFGHYAGVAHARHGGALFVAWVLLVTHNLRRPLGLRIALVFLMLSCLSGVEGRIQEIRRNYSDGAPIARLIRRELNAQKRADVKVFLSDEIYGYVIAAVLDRPIYSGADLRAEEFPTFTRERERTRALEAGALPWARVRATCRADVLCVAVLRPKFNTPPADFHLIYSPTNTVTDEGLAAYELR